MDSLIKLLFLTLSSVLFLTSCSSLQGVRTPASSGSSSVAQDEQMVKFYISQFPADKRGEFSIQLTDIELFLGQCRSGQLAKWMSASMSTQQQNEKEQTLSAKLNRPLYFQRTRSEGQKIHFVGSFDDFKEFVCISLALNDGKTASQITNALSARFFETTAKLPNINFQTLQLVTSIWFKSSLDVKAGVSIVKSSAFDYYQATEVINSLFRLNMPSDDRLKMVQAFVDTDIFSAHSFEFSQNIMRNSSNVVSPDERIKIINGLLASGKLVDKEEILNYLLSGIETGVDYTSTFQSLIEGSTSDLKFEAFSSILNSGGKIQNSEKTFLKIWSIRRAESKADSMIRFAINDWDKQLWLSRPAIISVISEALTAKVAPSSLDAVILFLTLETGIDSKTSINFLNLIKMNQELSSARAVNVINAAYVTRKNAPASEAELTPIVLEVRSSFSSQPDVNEAFFRYITWMNNLSKKISLVENLMKSENIDESLLISIARNAYAIKLDGRVALIAEILKQETITDFGLSEMVPLLSVNPFKISDAEKELLLKIKANSKSSAATSQKIEMVLKPTWQIIQDPQNRR